MLMARHGDSIHVLRPDFVYKTSVLMPSGGFNPVMDVMATTDAFTLGPMQFQQGSGLGRSPVRFLGPSPVRLMGPMSTLQMWWANFKAKWAAFGLKKRLGLGFTPYGPKRWAGNAVVPAFMMHQNNVAQMGTNQLPGQFAAITAMQNRYR